MLQMDHLRDEFVDIEVIKSDEEIIDLREIRTNKEIRKDNTIRPPKAERYPTDSEAERQILPTTICQQIISLSLDKIESMIRPRKFVIFRLTTMCRCIQFC